MTIRIAMWSGPRNISTAMMRAWENRADTQVTDEPFYACYLAETGLDHPMRAEVLAAQPTDWQTVAAFCAGGVKAPIHFQKHMCQHMVPRAPLGWMAACRHAFLIRPPEAVAASFHKGWPQMGADDLGFRRQAELFDHVCQTAGAAPPVIESRDVLEAPEAALRALCAALGVPFDPAMLSWPAGPRDSDGVWAAHWYGRVNRSTGFAGYTPPGPVPAGLEGIVAECQPHYQRMAAHRLKV
ncbi:MAG TPA: HAD family hydrolase [Thermohalobaculum sp.]|nr:HAD family hydrolase [Thermohalobaculum sp.]